MTPQDAAKIYITHCKGRDLSLNSLSTYGHALGWLIRALPTGEFSDVTPTQLRAAWESVAAEPSLCPNTLRLYRVILAGWLDFCVAEAGLPENGIREIPLPKKVTPYRPKVTIQRLYALRTACARLESDYARLRALALLEVLWSSLTRRAEVMNLRVAHLRLEEDPPALFIDRGKGGWTGWLPISDTAAAALRAWVVARGNPPHDWLWCNQGEKRIRMAMRALYHLLSRLAGIAGVSPDECKPHAVRRGSSTAMLQAGIDIATVSKNLRHRSIQTTWDYVEASQIRLADTRNWMADVERAADREQQKIVKEDARDAKESEVEAREAKRKGARQSAIDRGRPESSRRRRMLPPGG